MRDFWKYIAIVVLALLVPTKGAAQEDYTVDKVVKDVDGPLLINFVYDPTNLVGKEVQERLNKAAKHLVSEKLVCVHTLILPSLPEEDARAYLHEVTEKLKRAYAEEGKRRLSLLFTIKEGGSWAFYMEEVPRLEGPFSPQTEEEIISDISADMDAQVYGEAVSKAMAKVAWHLGMKDSESLFRDDDDDRFLTGIFIFFCLIAIGVVILFLVDQYTLLKRGRIGAYLGNASVRRITLITVFLFCLPALPLLPLYLFISSKLHQKCREHHPCPHCCSTKGYKFVKKVSQKRQYEELSGGAFFIYDIIDFVLTCKNCQYFLIEREVIKLTGKRDVTLTREAYPTLPDQYIRK